jgi:hypothetical protein
MISKPYYIKSIYITVGYVTYVTKTSYVNMK